MSIRAVVDMLREQHGLPDTWNWYRVAWLPSEKPLYLEIEGAEAPLKKTGKNKGRPNYAKKFNYRKFQLPTAEVRELEAEWTAKTGKCLRCEGEGKYAWSWSATEGTKHRECETCKGTGANGTETLGRTTVSAG